MLINKRCKVVRIHFFVSFTSQHAFTVTYCYHRLGNFSAMLPRTNASCSGVSFLFLPYKCLLFPGTLSFAVIMRWTIAVETLQRSAISVNVRFVVVLRVWTETFCFLRYSFSRCHVVYGFSSADMIPYYSLACFGKLTLE